MTWEMFLAGVGSGLTGMIIAGVLVGFNKYLCIVMCTWIVCCAAFGIAGMITHTIVPSVVLPAEAIPTH